MTTQPTYSQLKEENAQLKQEVDRLRKEATSQTEIIEHEKFLKSIVENIEIGIFVIDVIDETHFLYRTSNRKNVEQMGIPFEVMEGKPVEVIERYLGKEITEKVQKLHTTCTQNKKTVLCELPVFRNNETRWYFMKITPILDTNGKVIRLVGSSIDISERKNAEDEVKHKTELYHQQVLDYEKLNVELTLTVDELNKTKENLKLQNEEYETLNEELTQINEELQIAKDYAERNDKLKSAFLANMSHEIRTPMNSVVGFAEILNDPDTPEYSKQRFSEIIKESGLQLLELVNDIIDISKIETGQMTLNIELINLNEMLHDLHLFFEPVARKNKLDLYVSTPPDLKNIQLNADAIKLRQILNNLISNALKFTHKGFVKFGYSIFEDNIRFFVEDTGIGISEKEHELVFDRFQQAKRDPQQHYKGTGLGLAIAKANVELMQGNITISSEEGKGTTFFVNIPRNLD